MQEFNNKTVIFANGVAPEHSTPLQALSSAQRIICCDGAVDKLIPLGYEPDWIVGDLDSISDSSLARYRARIIATSDQQRNDFTKAFKLCLARGWRDIVVIGATGGREDHTLGNLSLLVDFARQLKIVLLSDTGCFLPLTDSSSLDVVIGQQISIFSFDPETSISSKGLKYPLNNIKLNRWWQASLNEADSQRVSLDFSGGPLLVFLAYIG